VIAAPAQMDAGTTVIVDAKRRDHFPVQRGYIRSLNTYSAVVQQASVSRIG
jgi:hypothetical protein